MRLTNGSERKRPFQISSDNPSHRRPDNGRFVSTVKPVVPGLPVEAKTERCRKMLRYPSISSDMPTSNHAPRHARASYRWQIFVSTRQLLDSYTKNPEIFRTTKYISKIVSTLCDRFSQEKDWRNLPGQLRYTTHQGEPVCVPTITSCVVRASVLPAVDNSQQTESQLCAP